MQFPVISLCFCFSIILLTFREFMKNFFNTLYPSSLLFLPCHFIFIFLRLRQLLSRQNWIQLRWFELLWLWYVYCPKFGWRLKQISRRLLLFAVIDLALLKLQLVAFLVYLPVRWCCTALKLLAKIRFHIRVEYPFFNGISLSVMVLLVHKCF